MAEGGYEKDLSHSTLIGSEDGDLSRSIQMGSQDCYEYYCQPCDVDHNQVEATFYCRNCHEYMCRKCSTSHKKFKELSDHEILDVKRMTYKPPVSKKRPASTRAVTMATHVKDIKVGSDINSSALMSKNQLLVADCDNNKVRLVDTVYWKQVSDLKLSGEPWQVTRISDIEAAVTILDEHMVVLLTIQQKTVLQKTKQKLSVVREIRVKGKCLGLAYIDNRLIVSFSGHVDILDMSGTVLRTISSDQIRKKSFTDPCYMYITVDPVTGSRFLSVWERGGGYELVKLSKEGSVEATYGGDCLSWPHQVALDTQGMIYVAWTDTMFGQSGRVEQLGTSCDWVRTIIPDLASQPRALSYDEATQQLYVGLDNKVVKVYKLS